MIGDGVILVFVFALGACVGSFLNVLVYRLPRGESIVQPGSHCPKCDTPIRAYDNIPIFSWLILRGRCRHCHVRISPRYLLVELATALMLVGLYVAYFMLEVRQAPARQLAFSNAWPMFAAHSILLCGLLACSIIDIKTFHVPWKVMWTVGAIGALVAAVSPHPFLPHGSPMQSGLGLAAVVGLLLGRLAIRKGWLRPSFAGLDDETEPPRKPKARKNKRKGKKSRGKVLQAAQTPPKRTGKKPESVGYTKNDGVNPRVEILRELLFLTPAILLAAGAWALLRHSPAVASWWSGWFNKTSHPDLAPRLIGAGGSLFGFLVGASWVWGTRIFGTLGFGREAIGLGDADILGGIGAVTGWIVPSLAFFVAPLAGIIIILFLYVAKKQRELPYGPWLAYGTVLVLLFYDPIVNYLRPGLTILFGAN